MSLDCGRSAILGCAVACGNDIRFLNLLFSAAMAKDVEFEPWLQPERDS